MGKGVHQLVKQRFSNGEQLASSGEGFSSPL